jgi:hypothetical protein
MTTNFADSNASLLAGWPANTRRIVFGALAFTALASASTQASAACNGGSAVTGNLTISSSCDGGGWSPLTLKTGAAVTINSGVTVSNTAAYGRNGDPISVRASNMAESLINNGSISTSVQWGVTVSGGLQNLENFGTIASFGRRGVVVQAGGSIGTITNAGTIYGPFEDITNSSGANSIGTLNNLQGAGNASGGLTYVGVLPDNYDIIIDSKTSYGQLHSDGTSGSMAFAIYGGGVSGVAASTIVAGTYQDVLTGFTTLNGVSGTTGSYDKLSYALVSDAEHAGDWNLVVSPSMTAGVPEPGTWALMLGGFVGLGVTGYRRRRAVVVS